MPKPKKKGLIWSSAVRTLLRNMQVTKLILCFIVRASRCICVMKTNLMHYLTTVYFVCQPLHDSGIFLTHHQEIYPIYIYIYNSVALVRMRTIPTERPPPVGEVSANFCG